MGIVEQCCVMLVTKARRVWFVVLFDILGTRSELLVNYLLCMFDLSSMYL